MESGPSCCVTFRLVCASGGFGFPSLANGRHEASQLQSSDSPLLESATPSLFCSSAMARHSVVSIGRAVFMPGRPQGGSYLSSTVSLAVRKAAQPPSGVGGETCSQDPILSELRGPVQKPCP